MGTTSNAAKHRWNKQNYDTFRVYMPKGTRSLFREACERADVSMNSVLTEAVDEFIRQHGPELQGWEENAETIQ